MNRSIKFRFFMGNYSNPKYEYWDNLIKIGGGKLVGDYLLKTNPLIIIEQYTGLKDKNGIEIYEGDIAIYELNKEIGVCVISPYHGVYFECLNEDTFGTCEEMILKIEIIGNIHENADLLND